MQVGVSATHLDHSMVPYVRKSFRKHYVLSWIKNLDEYVDIDLLAMSHRELRKWIENKTTEFFLATNFEDSDFRFDNKDKIASTKELRRCYQDGLFDTKLETYQAVEGMYHNLNTLQSRSGNQLPFTSVNYGTCTELEGRMVTKALLECCMTGLGKFGRTSIFPCGIFQIMKGVNKEPGTPNYDLKRLALESCAKRIYPNFCNCDWSGNAGYDINDPRTYFSTMGKNSTAHLKSFEPCLKGVSILLANG